jgi:general secretion pathway protein C
MDVATHILQWKERPPEEWVRAANGYLPQIVSALLILALAHRLAAITWFVIPGTPPDAPRPAISFPTSPAPSNAPEMNFRKISESHLFDQAVEVVAPVVSNVVDAPDTNLNLELRGVVSGRGVAIIASGNGQEKKYIVEDTIEGSGNTVLHAVYENRVILNRSGNLETLRLPQEVSANAVTVTTRAETPAPRAAASTSLQDIITSNASRITDILRVAPHIDQGQMVGFRINPGQARDQFDALGLFPGDVVTEINGTAMTDPSRGLQVFEALGEATVASVTVLRNGQPEVLAIDTSQLEGLAEDRQ